MQTRLTRTIAPLKNNNFETALFSFPALKTALWKQRYLCQKFPLPIPFYTWKISCFECNISHACLFTRVSFGTLSVSNSSLLWTKALACKTMSIVTLIVLLITYVHIWETSGTVSVPCHRTRACAFTFFPVFPWRVTFFPPAVPSTTPAHGHFVLSSVLLTLRHPHLHLRLHGKIGDCEQSSYHGSILGSRPPQY